MNNTAGVLCRLALVCGLPVAMGAVAPGGCATPPPESSVHQAQADGLERSLESGSITTNQYQAGMRELRMMEEEEQARRRQTDRMMKDAMEESASRERQVIQDQQQQEELQQQRIRQRSAGE